MGWSELSRRSKVKLESGCKGFLDITAKSNNLNTAIENALDKLYFNYEGKKFISIEVNRNIIFLDRYDNPTSNTFCVMGRRYKKGSDIFLTKTIPLGKVNIDTWDDYGAFCSQMQPLSKCWVKLIQQDKELNSDYQW